MINQQDLISHNYIKNEWFDKNDPKDTYNTLKFIEYKKEINEYFSIEVTFGFLAIGLDNWYSAETSCELNGGGEFLQLPKDIEKLEQIYELLKQEP